MTPTAGEGPGSDAASPSTSPTMRNSGKQDLLMRFFESDFFDAWIAVTYLHKTLAQATHEYLCDRLFTLPEADVERYLSQLTQLAVTRRDAALGGALADLCAQSLRIAVKTYWLLLAISQDNPGNDHVAVLRDTCEQAGLVGHWDLPFKDSRLPSPIGPAGMNGGILGRYRRSSSSQPPTPQGATAPAPALGAASSFSFNPASSPIPVATPAQGAGPLGLSGIDIPRGASPDLVPRMSRWRSGALSPDVPSRPLSPDGLGNGIHSSVFMDTGVEGLIYESTADSVDNPRDYGLASRDASASSMGATPRSQPGSAGRRWRSGSAPRGARAADSDGGSPPTSPKRRETTFGATLDFIEALCAASSNLTVFQPEDRRWALQKALRSINAEMDRASSAGVAIWWPMGRSLRQRVVRLAYKESKLLNSHEKAPFTLYVEVLNEAAAEAEAEAAAAAAERQAAAEQQLLKLPPLPQEMEPDPAAAAAAAEGIPWVPHHHRRSSSMDTASSSLLAAAAMAAVQGSSAAGSGPRPASENAGVPTPPPPGDALLAVGATAADAPPSLVSQRSNASTLATDLSFADFVSEGSHSPPGKRPLSGGSAGDEDAHAQQAQHGGPGSSSLPPLPRAPVQGGGHWIGGSNVRIHPAAHNDLSTGLSEALAALRGDSPAVTVHLAVLDDVSLEGIAVRGGGGGISRMSSEEAPGSVSAGSASSDGAQTPSSPVQPPRSRAAVAPEPPTVAAVEAALAPGAGATCSKNGWMCKLGLCKACAAAGKAPAGASPVSVAAVAPTPPTAPPAKAEPAAAPPAPSVKEPRVKLTITVQSGLNLAIKRSPGGPGPGHRRMPSHEALLHVAREHKLPVPPAPTSTLPATPEAPAEGTDASPASPAAAGPSSVHGEPFSALKERLKAASPHGARPGWDLRPVIVKSGDDCRQELLAMQLISTLAEIFAEAGLPLWLKPYEVLVTSNRTALIEMVTNAPSIHGIKARRGPGVSLRDHFVAEFGGEGSIGFAAAQRNFVESMAAYSLVCYLLQIKDRHNGNILLDDSGHVIHIDFGFMLSNSPGGVNFESAPFKLTRELLEVMDSDSEGRASQAFDYYKVLMIQGFLAARRHAERITVLVEMMSESGCPCFKNKSAAVGGVRRRLAPGLAEPAVVEMVLGLISDSLDAWRTRQYDYYQRVLNGIL